MKLSLFSFLFDLISFIHMIQEAIMDLNEEGGSTKDAISQFTMRKYDVFQVHVAKLIEQLEKLVEKEELVFTAENRYMLPAEDTVPC